jgi:hypothetical protein
MLGPSFQAEDVGPREGGEQGGPAPAGVAVAAVGAVAVPDEDEDDDEDDNKDDASGAAASGAAPCVVDVVGRPSRICKRRKKDASIRGWSLAAYSRRISIQSRRLSSYEPPKWGGSCEESMPNLSIEPSSTMRSWIFFGATL